MSFRLVILIKAQAEMFNAVDWYEIQKVGLGKRFIFFLENYLEKIRLNPSHFPEKSPSFREAYKKEFPYLIIYQVNNDEVVIFSVFHVKQNPDKKYF